MNARSAGIIFRDGKILLMRRRKNKLEYFAVPGGTIEEGEDPQSAVIREIKEETGLDAVVGELFFEFDGIKGYEYFFMVDGFSGNEKLGGPELERNCEENFYELSWIELTELSRIDLKPLEVKRVILENFSK